MWKHKKGIDSNIKIYIDKVFSSVIKTFKIINFFGGVSLVLKKESGIVVRNSFSTFLNQKSNLRGLDLSGIVWIRIQIGDRIRRSSNYWAFHILPQICTTSAEAHISSALKQMQYRFAVNFWALRICNCTQGEQS